MQGSHRLEKYLNLECFLEKSLKIKSSLKSTGNSVENHSKALKKSLNCTIFCIFFVKCFKEALNLEERGCSVVEFWTCRI